MAKLNPDIPIHPEVLKAIRLKKGKKDKAPPLHQLLQIARDAVDLVDYAVVIGETIADVRSGEIKKSEAVAIMKEEVNLPVIPELGEGVLFALLVEIAVSIKRNKPPAE